MTELTGLLKGSLDRINKIYRIGKGERFKLKFLTE